MFPPGILGILFGYGTVGDVEYLLHPFTICSDLIGYDMCT